MARDALFRALVIILSFCVLNVINGQVLTPPTFNLAQGREISASATCGYGVAEPELYCTLTGATGKEEDNEIIQGQLCDYCVPSNPKKNHSAIYAIDGTENYWQSPPLSRGDEFNKVDLVIDLDQEFHIAYIIIKMAKSPRPGIWALEKSSDYGETYVPWQYFADNPNDCMRFFNTEAGNQPDRDDEVLCVTDYSGIVPLEDGEIFVSLTNGRPNAKNFSYADDLKDFLKATNVRIRLIRAKTLLGHLMAVANQDPSVTRRYFYSIKDISLGGRCVCNGHANNCFFKDPTRPYKLICDCQHNTVGDQCERCDEEGGFVQKKWQPARYNSVSECEPCQCYNRATGCKYDPEVDAAGLSIDIHGFYVGGGVCQNCGCDNRATGCKYDPEVDAAGLSIDIHGFYVGGGVCQNCGYNSTGINCEKCVPGFYRPYGTPLTDLDMCKPCECDPRYHINECEEETGRCKCRPEYDGYRCDRCAVGYYGYPDCIPCACDVNGTEGDVCYVEGGQCPCKENYVGTKCDMCKKGFYDFPSCIECDCNMIGSSDEFCNEDDGQCKCKMNYGTRNCSECAHGYFNFPDCTLCQCDPTGTVDQICDKESGECMCKETFNGERCDVCARGYYGYPDCMPCLCQEPGSTSNVCEDKNGQCTCKFNFAGQNCERCASGFYRYPDCIPCDCDLYGSLGQSCDQETGQCDCRPNFQGLNCDKCREGLYNYPNCEECNCNPAGAKEIPGFPLGGCGEVVAGTLCECKEKVIGRICDMCLPGYWNLNRNNPQGCEECGCSDAGTIAGINDCNMITGQCVCKVDVTGRNCDRCKDGFYGLHKTNLFGCIECNCDPGGSMSLVCDRETGQCPCKGRVQGRRCDQPIKQHFIPPLDQLKYEVEDGYTPEGTQVRYGYDERLFPNYSWRGYAILSQVQPEVRLDVEIDKPSLYRVLYRYVNLNEGEVKGTVTFNPESSLDTTQRGEVTFQSTSSPDFANVGTLGFVLNPGRWAVAIQTDDSVFLDFFILIPQSYFEAGVLQNRVQRPCTVPGDIGPCIHYSYPELLEFPNVKGDTGYIFNGTEQEQIRLFIDANILDELNIDSMGVLDPEQNSFNLDLYIPQKDKYVLVLNYYSNANGTQDLLFNFANYTATAVLYKCDYSSLCRQVLLGLDEMEGVFELDEGLVNVLVTGGSDVNAGIESIVAIPYSTWAINYIRPSIVCIRVNGVCISSRYMLPIGSVRIDFESLPNDHLIAEQKPPGLEDTEIELVRLNDTLNLVVLLGTARSTGPHKFLVHYYLPYDLGYTMPITLVANGQEYKGEFRPRYCPGHNGCRDRLFFYETGETGNMNLTDPNVKVIFNNTGDREIWLDYLLLTPASQYTAEDIILQPVDNSLSFIDECLDEGFNIKMPISEFCEKSLFTLTTDFNNGALECECNIDGSLSFNCEPYGGQCQCRPNVIGRKCSACRVGYYGFPRCKPCNCPFGLCQQVTGQCICPPRVTGDRCDTCIAGTYGYDALIGCQECLCNPQGVVDGNMSCDAETGQCQCLPGIGGRKCDYCLAGFYAFPSCRECDCDRSGTIEEICDPNTARCLCKENVVGPRCDQCDIFTYNLDPANPMGCTNCFCFGNTQNCRESSYVWSSITDMLMWGITNTVDGVVREAGTTIAVLDIDDEDKIENTNVSMYWTAPKSYLGNKVRSYGGYINYNVLYVLPRNDSIQTEAFYEPDVIMVGNNMTIVHISSNQPDISRVTAMEVQLLEYNFEHLDSGKTVTREEFMMILVNVQALHIRANYYTVVGEIRLIEFEMEYSMPDGTGATANTVEECACPAGYIGTSCEHCAQGYYRARTFPYLGVCVPCQCYGHAESCDINTGQCIDCQNNTMGFNCDQCRPGYYGDPYREGCTICGCPLETDSNNFADTCSVTGDGYVLTCDCYEGYMGDKCDRCSPGYYGNPRILGDTCERCECNNNIDMTNPDSCDFDTGACLICSNNSTGRNCERCRDWWYGDAIEAKDCYPCLICSNNSTGRNCERCRDWWYGDAIEAKDCYPCSCEQCGSLTCDNKNGQCTCKPNVIGINCDRCAPDTYGFDSCNGCTNCDCAEASISTQCDLQNGTCFCQPGVVGRRCDQCEPGYWNYQETGCTQCNCEYDGAVSCDPADGSCQCLPGVTGERCDRCLDRWILIPQRGCQACESCIHHLLDDMDRVDMEMDQVRDGLATVSIGVEAMKRLERANQSVSEMEPKLFSILYESENITLDGVAADIDQINMMIDAPISASLSSIEDATGLLQEGDLLLNRSSDAVDMGMDSEQEADSAIMHVRDVLQQINEGIRVTNIETYIVESETILDEIKMKNFSEYVTNSTMEQSDAESMTDSVKSEQVLPMAQEEAVKNIMDNIDMIKKRLMDLQNNSQTSEAVSTRATNLINKLRDENVMAIGTHIDGILMEEQVTLDTIMSAQEKLNESRTDIDTSDEEFKEKLSKSRTDIDTSDKEFKTLEVLAGRMLQAIAVLQQNNEVFTENPERTAFMVNQSFDKAEELEEQADNLEQIYTDTRDIASNALKAGTAYENIVKAIENAQNATELALIAAESAQEKSSGVGEDSETLTNSSEVLLDDAKLRYNITQTTLLGRLDRAVNGTMSVKIVNDDLTRAKNRVNNKIDGMNTGDISDKSSGVVTSVNDTSVKSESVKLRIQGILDDLPDQANKVMPLKDEVVNSEKSISVSRTQVNNVQKVIPDINVLMTNLTEKSERVKKQQQGVTTSISSLKEKIAIARNQANLIRVGLKFLSNTTVTLRNPPNLAQAGSYNKVSLFFKTTSENGLLLYVGSERSGTGKAHQDYMAIEVENGYVAFKYNLGFSLTSMTHPLPVSDGKWYKVTVNRVGKTGTLMVEHGQNDKDELPTVSATSTGLNSVLDLLPYTTKFYAGGLPADNLISDDVTREPFTGDMESIEFDDNPVGLWNFEDGESNTVGAKERNIFQEVASNGFRFDGTGYVVLSKRKVGWEPAVSSQINFRLKTYADNGLVFFASDGKRDFISLEVKDGQILYQYDLGGGRASLTNYVLVNDGEWHSVQVNRLEKTGVLYVDQEMVGPINSTGVQTQLSTTDEISLGGYQDIILPIRDVTKQGFEGCIEDMTVQLGILDLNENEKAKGVIPGCPDVIARIATFTSEELSYVKNPLEGIGASFEISFKMKTLQKEALLLYIVNVDGDAGMSVSIKDGMIHVISDLGAGQTTEMMTRVNTYNDGRWHYISIMKVISKLMMNIDDSEQIIGDLDGEQNTIDSQVSLYFGNTDSDMNEGLVATTTQLDGCIGDVTINGEFLNFAIMRADARPGISLSGCPIVDPDSDYERPNLTVPVLPPFPTFPPGRCALEATEPVVLADEDIRGTYFGASNSSRMEYRSFVRGLRVRSAFMFEIKTSQPDNVIFYFADSNHVDHMALVMKEGKIRYSFNSGTGSGVITTDERYDDGKWHMLEVGRYFKEGSLRIDNVEIGTVKSQGSARSINGQPPFYFGGLNGQDLSNAALRNLDGVTTSFHGCIGHIKLNGKPIPEVPVQTGTVPCSDLTENGAYFFNEGGYIKLTDNFKVGLDLTVSVEVRPRSYNGVIFSVHGSKGDFVVLQMVEGELRFTADNGGGDIMATFAPEMNNKLCDGMWHTITAVKNKNVVSLTVDDMDTITTVSARPQTQTDTNNPFYIGGNPDTITKGIKTKGEYLGCLRNLFINGERAYFAATGIAFNDVTMDACPIN